MRIYKLSYNKLYINLMYDVDKDIIGIFKPQFNFNSIQNTKVGITAYKGLVIPIIFDSPLGIFNSFNRLIINSGINEK
jgi:hypothetical protein